MYYENIQSLIAFKNNETIDILENPFIKLYSDSQYYIEYKLYYTAHLDLYFYEQEINKVTFSGIEFQAINEGIYYFLLEQGLKMVE